MLIDIATSSPPFKVSQIKAAEELKKRMSTSPAIGRLIDTASSYSGINTRYVVIPDGGEDSSSKFYSVEANTSAPGTKARMVEYEKWAKSLSVNAVQKLIDTTGLDPKTVNKLITISCTGFYAPGIDYDLIKYFNLPNIVKRTNIGFMGCAASLIGFNSVLEAMNANNNSCTLLVSLELCSLHLQTQPTRDNILANMIFADGCAAALFSNSNNFLIKPKLELIKTHSITFDNSAEIMGWKIGNYGFEMILDSDLPKLILKVAIPSLITILNEDGIRKEDIKYWALHPGGRAVLDALQNGLELDSDKMTPSRNILCNYGNLSSASILFVLKEILDTSIIHKNDLCCAVAFGPGLSMEVALLKGI
jgi:predicted naringenin-chalcone synthase